MRIIHCSQSLLKEIKEPVVKLRDVPDHNSGLGVWYGDIFRHNRKKYLIFTNEQTLYTFFVYDIKKKDMESLSSIFRDNMMLYLDRVGVEKKIVNRIAGEYGEIAFSSSSNNSRVEELMNYFIDMLRNRLDCIDDVTEREILVANMKMNTTELEELDYSYPAHKMKELIIKNYSAAS